MTNVTRPRLYTARDASRLTGASAGQLEHFYKSGVIRPRRDSHGRGDSRLYDFANLAEITVALELLDQGVSVRVIRCAIAFLRGLWHATPAKRNAPNRAMLVVTREESYYAPDDLSEW